MNKRITVFSVTLALLTMSCLHIATAQIVETKLVARDGDPLDYFGISVSLSGDYALVGAYRDHHNGINDAGAAYIFHFDGPNWVAQTKLIASDGATFDHFGLSVSLSGDYALIGSHDDDDNGADAGSAYIFHNDGSNWVEQTKLIASDGAAGDYFGWSVSLSGNYALVGAYGDNANAGSAYIFHFDGSSWVEQTKLTASDGDTYDYFGYKVSLSGDFALVGAQQDDENGAYAGSAYIFHYNGSNWEQTKLTASGGDAYDYFGGSVSLSGNYALVGAWGDDDNGSYSGAAYIFHYDGSSWVEQTKLTASAGDGLDFFGTSVSLSGDYALIGSDNDDDNGADAGSAYIFHNDGSNWVEQTKLIAGDGAAGDNFGTSVSLSGNYALVGAYGDDDSGRDAGSVYVYAGNPVCEDLSQFQARCRSGGLIKARVIMADASHAGDIVEISIDDVPYEVTIDASGRGQLSQGGFSSGPHTVELTNPGQCFDPIVVTCRTSLDKESSDDWDDELISETPTETALVGNYPNPFNPSTTFSYTLSEPGQVSLKVYNTLGQLVRTIVDQEQVQGHHEAVWDGRNEVGATVASGIYIYRMVAGNYVETKRMLLLK